MKPTSFGRHHLSLDQVRPSREDTFNLFNTIPQRSLCSLGKLAQLRPPPANARRYSLNLNRPAKSNLWSTLKTLPQTAVISLTRHGFNDQGCVGVRCCCVCASCRKCFPTAKHIGNWTRAICDIMFFLCLAIKGCSVVVAKIHRNAATTAIHFYERSSRSSILNLQVTAVTRRPDDRSHRASHITRSAL